MNEIEDGTNSQMLLLLLRHRGMTGEHQRRAIEWRLYLHPEHPEEPVTQDRKPCDGKPKHPAKFTV
ncbi:hypothetical protein G7066_01490 [Leucobacter coleopterorum]|uniref:Transposase n=1 Tax=Leucobacter coleopterorum TaxID=2714933 RepID=A0ABX6JXP2_9MICO|nr:hypothetical protein [Leucobacter coleopterorum]QIM17707.1 hypothetical protein G7066_01490 [Leucobacter coleopterorum]